jgi:hypothetical protein
MAPLVETYDRHLYLAEKARALQAWADQLDRIVAAEPGAVRSIRRTGLAQPA